jgi:hypothetical protein
MLTTLLYDGIRIAVSIIVFEIFQIFEIIFDDG